MRDRVASRLSRTPRRPRRGERGPRTARRGAGGWTSWCRWTRLSKKSLETLRKHEMKKRERRFGLLLLGVAARGVLRFDFRYGFILRCDVCVSVRLYIRHTALQLTCCSRGLHRTPESLTKSQEHRAVPPRRSTFYFRPPAPAPSHGAGRGTWDGANGARIAQDLGSPGGTQCSSWLAYGTADWR